MLSKFHTLEKKLLLFTTGILILALAISVFVVRGIYRPIRKIASLLQLQNYAPEIPAPRMDALNYISQTLEQVDHQYRHIQETAQLLVQRNLLRSMLLGVTPSGLDEQSVQHARTAILDALSPYYMVLLRMDHAASYTKLSQEQRRLLVECLSAAGLLNVKTGAYDKEILRLYGLEDAWEKLPPLHGSAEILGRVTESFSARTGLPAGTPVLGGLFDVNSCMLGAGVIQTNRFSMTAGTWGINAIPAAAPVVAKNITQCCQFYGEVPYVCIDSAPTSCANLEWYAKKMMHTDDFPALSQMVQERPSEPELFFLPYLYAPMDLPQLSGGFVGLKPHHDQIDLLRAVFEGIVFEHRRRMEKLQSNGLDAESLVLSGGASGSPVFAQLFADICNKEVLIPQQSQAGAMGGVLLSQMAAGVYASLSDAVASLVRYKQSRIPIHASNYEQKYQRFCDLIRKR